MGNLLQELFSSPVALCRRLADRPTWLLPMVVLMGTGLLMSALWLWKMDPVASVQANLDVVGRVMANFHQTLPEQAIQQALDQAKRPVVGTLLGSVVAPWLVALILSVLLWGASRIGSVTEERPVSFQHAFSVAVVQSLPMALTQVLTAVMILAKPVGGLTMMALNPATVGYFMAPDNLLFRGLTVGLLDPLYLFSWVLMVLGLKHTLRARTWAIILVCGLIALVALPIRLWIGIF